MADMDPNELAQKKDNIHIWVRDLASEDSAVCTEAATCIRKILSIERNPPIDEVIEAGAIPLLVALLDHKNAAIQYEAAWALTNIASGSQAHTQAVVSSGALPKFVEMVTSPQSSEDVKEQAVWALGNVAGDSAQFRDHCLAIGAMQAVLTVLAPAYNDNAAVRISIVRNATWMISNLHRGKPAPRADLVSSSLPLLARLVSFNDDEVVTDALWALSYFVDGPNDRIQAVLNLGVLQRLVELMGHQSANIQTPALRCVGNIVTGDDIQTQAVINAGALPYLGRLVQSNRKGLRKEACWALSNITAGSRFQIQSVLDADVFPALIQVVRNDQLDVAREALFAVSNATSGCSFEQLRAIKTYGLYEMFTEALSRGDAKYIMVALEGLENCFTTAQSNGVAEEECAAFEAAGGLDRLEEMQQNPSEEVYSKAVSLLERFFAAEEGEDEEPEVPLAQAQDVDAMDIQSSMSDLRIGRK